MTALIDLLNFDSVTGDPSGWTDSSNSWATATAPSGMSGKWYASTQQSVGGATKWAESPTFTRNTSGYLTASFQFKTGASTAQRWGYFLAYDGANFTWQVIATSDGNFYFTGTASTALFAYAANTVYTVTVVHDLTNKKAKLTVNGTTYDNSGSWYAVQNASGGLYPDNVKLDNYSAAGTNAVGYDLIEITSGQRFSATVTADAAVANRTTKTVTADAVIKTTATATADALIVNRITATATADALVKAVCTITADAVIIGSVTRTATVTVDAIVKATSTSSTTADAIVKQTSTAPITADAVVKQTVTQAVSVDGFIKSTVTRSLTADALAGPGAGVLYSTGTNNGIACGCDAYSRITLVYTEANSATGLVVERSADGTTWSDVSSASYIVITNPSAGVWKIVDRRPQYGSGATTFGGIAYYRVRSVVNSAPGRAVTTSLTANVNAKTVRAQNYSAFSTYMAGSYIASSAGGAIDSNAYPGEPLQTMALAYLETGISQYRTDAINQFNYMASSSLTNIGGLVVFPGYSDIRADFHFRTIYHTLIAARLMRLAGDSSTAATWIAQCDTWAKAGLDNLNGGSPYGTVTTAGYRANNQPAWTASTSYVKGAIVRPTTTNNRSYRAMNAGTSGSTQPTWPTTVGGTVTDNGITWRETSGTGIAFYENYNISTYSQTNGSLTPYTLNQQIEIGAVFALLSVESASSFYSSGTYRTKALDIISGTVAITTALQDSTGGIPLGDQNTVLSTLYGAFVSETMSVIYRVAGSQHAAHDIYISRALDWLSGFETEPLTGISTSGTTTTNPYLFELMMRASAYDISSRSSVTAGISYSTAFWDADTAKWSTDYKVNGDTVAANTVIKRPVWEAEAIRQGVLSLKNVTVDALVSGRPSKSLTADAAIKGTQTATLTVDGVVAAAISKTLTADAIVYSPGNATKTVTADALIVNQVTQRTQTYTADAKIIAPGLTKTFNADAIISGGQPGAWWLLRRRSTESMSEPVKTYKAILPSSTRTSTYTSPTAEAKTEAGVVVILDVTAASGTGGLSVRINAVDQVSGQSAPLNATPNPVTTTGTYTYALYPFGAIGGNATQVTSFYLPRNFNITVTHGDSSSYAYSVGYCLLP